MQIATFQIGKFGVTPGVTSSLHLYLKNHDSIRISVLKSSGRDKKSIVEMAEKIIQDPKLNCKYKIVGFTIILKRLKRK